MQTYFDKLYWTHTTNIYEVNLRQYTQEGTFKAFEKEMPRLRKMGIEVLWFMPITPISELKKKGTLGSYYAAQNYTATNPEFGTVADFKALVQYAHQLGFKVIIDWVANHTGWDHVWTSQHPDYFVKDSHGHFTEKNGWEDVIDLDFTNRDMRNAMIAAMQFWIAQCDIDGFRCDMAMLVPLDFWKEARTRLDESKKLFWLAECEEAHYHEAFDATYSWEWMHITEDFYKQKTGMHGLDNVLNKYNQNFPATALRAFFTTNHDENSWNGTEYEKYGPVAKPLAVFSCTWNGLPLIYSGQELPNTKRLKFFDKDAIEWTGNYEMEYFYTTLLALRKNNPALSAADAAVNTYRLHTNADDTVMCFLRKNGAHEVLVVLHLSDNNDLQCTINDPIVTGVFANVFGGPVHDFYSNRTLNLKAWDYLVFEK